MMPKKLLVLDVNGLLVDTYFHKEPLPEESPDARVGNFYVYKRPFCDDFLQFCLDNFTVGVWSSAREYNVNNLVDYVFGDSKEKLAFSWHQSDCTDVGLKAPDNQWKPLFLKELSKLWRKVKVDLPWSEGDYGPSNTLLVDDTPYKAILNPPYTAIFPRSYTARDHGDKFLGGTLRSFLEGVRDAASVQTYVENNPFGEPSITPESPLWSYVGKVLLKVQGVLNKVGDDIAQVMPVEAVIEEVNKRDKHNTSRHRDRKHYSDPSHPEKNHTVEVRPNENMLQALRSDVQSHERITPYQPVKEAASLDRQQIIDMPLDDTDRVHITSSPLANLNQSWKDQESPVGSSFLKRKRELPEEFHALEQAQRRPQIAQKSALPTGNCDRAGGKQSENTGFSSSREQAFQGAFEGEEQAATRTQGHLKRAEKEHTEGKQADNVEHTNHKTFDKEVCNEGPHHYNTGIDVDLDMLQEQFDADGCDDNSLCEGSEDIKKSCIPVRSSSLKPCKYDCMQVENNDKDLLCGKQGMIARGDHSYVRVSNSKGASQFSDGCRNKHRRSQGKHIRSRSKINESNRESFSYGQGWKSKREYYQEGATKTPPFNGRDGWKHHSVYNQDPTYVVRHNAGRGYPNRDNPSFGYTRQHQQRWGDRLVDAPAEYAWRALTPNSRRGQSQHEYRHFSNTMASANASFEVLDSAFPTHPYKSQRDIPVMEPMFDEFGQVEVGGSSGYQGHHGFEQRAVYDWPERQNLHIPDSNLAVQPQARWDNLNGKRQRHNFANREAGSSSQLYRNAGAFNQPYRGEVGTSRQRYRNVGALKPNHNSRREKHRQRPPSREFSRNRQSQEGRNL